MNFEDVVNLYPNPSKDLFYIDLSQTNEQYTTITVYNLLGEKIFSNTVNPNELNSINLSNLANGYYLAKLEGNKKNTTLKLIKN